MTVKARLVIVPALLAGLLCFVAPTIAQTPLKTTRIASGLVRPIWVTHAPNDYHRLFVIEKQGFIRIIKDGVLLSTKFIDLDAIITGGTSPSSEQGLLGLAFHPDYANNGFFYVYYTALNSNDTLARYKVSADPDVADPTSGTILLSQADPFTNHNGGWVAFGPDNYLYLSIGDGGSGCDPSQNAQNINTLLGKILRLDVDGPAPYGIPATNPFVVNPPVIPHRNEIWDYGLRNAWRPSFDRATGDLWIADVGQSVHEEINFEPAGTGGRNYGWDCREGLVCSSTSPSNCGVTHCGPNCTEPPGTIVPFTNPIHVYSHSLGCSITGGYVYRGCAIPDLSGTYFFADYCSTTIWSLKYDGTTVTNLTNRTAGLSPGGGLSIASITSFGEDAYGEIYITDQDGGEVFKIIPAVSGPDCNNNNQPDTCDIAVGYSLDTNLNGIPDECECYPNCDRSNVPPYLNINDFICFQTKFALADPYADCDANGVRNLNDFICFQTKFALGCK